MKNLIKKLAFVMAIALVLTSLAPAASASAAASDMKINVSSKNLYLGESEISDTAAEYDFYIKNKPSNYKKLYSFTWTSSNTKVATVDNAGLTKAVTTGTATITCTITSKETGKVVAQPTTKVTVKQNAKAVTIYNYPDDQTAEVGETVDFNRKMTPKTGKGSATDKTKWILTDNTAGAKVTQSNGKVTTTKAGSYTITAYTYQSASYPLEKDDDGNYINYTSKSEPVTITVVDPDAAPTPTPTPAATQPVVTQQSVSAFKITFGTDMSSTITKNSLIIRDQNGISQFIKSFTFSDGGKVLSIELYNQLVNKTNYTITYGTTTLTFTASAGDVAMIELTGVKDNGNRVAPGEPGTLEYTLRDANGVIVSKPDTGYITYELVNDNYSAVLYDNQITLWEAGKTATVVATYHTNNYSTTTGIEITYKSNPFTVVCVETVAPTVSNIVAATVASTNVGETVSFTNPSTTISLSDDGTRYLVVKAVDTAGNIVYLNEFSSADSSRLIIDKTTGKLYPVATGATEILCYKDGAVVGVVTVTVTDYRKATSISVDKTGIVLSNSSQINDTATVTVTVKDQFGAEMAIDSMFVTKLNTNLSGYLTTEGTVYSNKLTFSGTGADSGTYTYKITVGSLNTVVSVSVRKAGTVATSYRLSASSSTLDMKITSNTDENRSIVLSLNGYDSAGTKVNASAGATLAVTYPDNTVHTYTTNSDGQVSIPVVQGGSKLLSTGIYRVTATVGSTVIQPITFSITDTQPKPSVGLSTTRFEVTAGTYIYSNLVNAIKATSNAGADSITVEITDDCVTGTIFGGYCSTPGTYYLAIKQVYVTETFGNSTVKTTYTFSTPQSVTIIVK
ncbi:MAG: Ig-like domain-containing protein [Lachnospiraceae bacterium]|nr:Ig-like domain-containing protein [Lachnospiraceae bacterium]